MKKKKIKDQDIATEISMKTLNDIATDEFNKTWTLIEDRDIYDGWCAKVHKETGEIVWREAWFTQRINKEKRKEWEDQLRNSNPDLFIKNLEQ